MAVPPQPPGPGGPGQPPFGGPPQYGAPAGMPGAPMPGQFPQQGAYPQGQYPQQGQFPQQPGAPYPNGAYPQQGQFPQQNQYPQQPGAYPQGAQYPASPYGAPQQPGGQFPGSPQFPNPAAYQGGFGAPPGQFPQQYPQPGAPPYGQAPYAPQPPQFGAPQYGAPPPVRGTAQAVPGAPYPGAPQYPGVPQYPAAPQYPGAPGSAMPRAPQGAPPQVSPPQGPPGARPPQAPWAGGTFAAPGLPPATAPQASTPPSAPPQSAPQAPAKKPAAAPGVPAGRASSPPSAPAAQPEPASKSPTAAPGGKGRSRPIPVPEAGAAAAPGTAGQGKSSAAPSIGAPLAKPAADSPAAIAAAARAAEAVAGPAVRQEHNPDDDIEDPVEELKKNAVPLLVSFAVNLTLIIILGLIVNPPVKKIEYSLEASFDAPGKESLAEIRSLAEATETLDMPDQRPLASLPQIPNPVKVPVDVFGKGPMAPITPPATHLPSSYAGRGISGGMKQALVNSRGGSNQTENAVDLGLGWLATHQMANGMWTLTGEAPVGKGKYSKGSSYENQEAATAMALLAFFGAGHTPNNGSPHAKVIDAGVKAILRSQDAKGNFFQGKKADDWMYTHALCTMAMCEYLALEPTNTSMRGPCEKAVKFCIESQHDWGGWRYTPRGDSDTSVTGWMLMALQSAKNAKIKVPKEVFDKIGSYLDRAQQGLDPAIDPRTVMATKDKEKLKTDLGSQYAYQPGNAYDHVMTAEGLLCRMYLGWSQDDKRLQQGCRFLLETELPTWDKRDVYYWYYGTQAMFHMEGEYWARWNGTLRDMLVANQEQSGPERGSWNPMGGGQDQSEGADLWSLNKAGGRLYVTCFTLYMLEVYYRHLPLYSELKKQMEARQVQ